MKTQDIEKAKEFLALPVEALPSAVTDDDDVPAWEIVRAIARGEDYGSRVYISSIRSEGIWIGE